jgi:hypothetical protein
MASRKRGSNRRVTKVQKYVNAKREEAVQRIAMESALAKEKLEVATARNVVEVAVVRRKIKTQSQRKGVGVVIQDLRVMISTCTPHHLLIKIVEEVLPRRKAKAYVNVKRKEAVPRIATESALARERLGVVTARSVVEFAIVKNRIQVLPFSCAAMAKATCCTTADQDLEVPLVLHDITESRDEGAKR